MGSGGAESLQRAEGAESPASTLSSCKGEFKNKKRPLDIYSRTTPALYELCSLRRFELELAVPR